MVVPPPMSASSIGSLPSHISAISYLPKTSDIALLLCNGTIQFYKNQWIEKITANGKFVPTILDQPPALFAILRYPVISQSIFQSISQHEY